MFPQKFDHQIFSDQFFLPLGSKKNSLDHRLKLKTIDPAQKFEVLLEFDTDDPSLVFNAFLK